MRVDPNLNSKYNRFVRWFKALELKANLQGIKIEKLTERELQRIGV